MNESGTDRELVLGNKQLLAIFFVAALLCGVFFAVGYVVGGNSAKSMGSTVADSSTASPVEGKRDEPSAVAPVSDAMAATATPGAADTAGTAPESRMTDNPAAAGSMPPPSGAAQAVPVPASQSTPGAKTGAPAASAPMGLSVPESGASYIQVAAQMRPAADATAKTLARAGWPTILAESSKPDWVEILVGPFRDGVKLADAKRKLIDQGFGGAFVHKQQ